MSSGDERHPTSWKELRAMIKELHKRSVHIDAPVEKVFDYVKDPQHFFEAFDGAMLI